MNNHALGSLRPLLRHALFPLLETVTAARFWSYYKQGKWTDFDPSFLEGLREERLRELLTKAIATPLHRQRLQSAGVDPNHVAQMSVLEHLRCLAPLTKEELRSHFPDGATTGNPDNWRFQSTAGTTTDRLTVVADFRKRDFCRACELRALRVGMGQDVAVSSVEIPPNACNVLCGVNDPAPPTLFGYAWHAARKRRLFTVESISEMRGRFERRVVLPRLTLDPIEPMPVDKLIEVLDHHLEAIVHSRPQLLRGFPVYLLWLAERARERSLSVPSLRWVAPFGGLTSPEMQRRIESGLGCPFTNLYGTSELGVVAVSCASQRPMHLFADAFMAEIFQGEQPSPIGEAGRLVVTDLVNQAMPLVRYEVGDMARMVAPPCHCGRATDRLEVLGRTSETLESPKGKVFPLQVADCFFSEPAIINFRLEEIATGVFEAAVVTYRQRQVDHAALGERFEQLYGEPVRLRVREKPFLRPQPSGKYCFVVPARKVGVST